jgi:hypothetical protein
MTKSTKKNEFNDLGFIESGTLEQSEACSCSPKHQLTVIKINSTYLECVDRHYFDRGIIITLLIGSAVSILLGLMPTLAPQPAAIMRMMVFFVFGFGFAMEAFFKSIHSPGIFSYTHFPIRFNRITKMVHVFRQNGTVMSESWEKLRFVLGFKAVGLRSVFYEWEVHGHRLAKDDQTVLDCFSLPCHFSNRSFVDEPEKVISLWEFVRQYMEDDPKNLIGQIETVHPIDKKYEPFWHGWRVLIANEMLAGMFAIFTLFLGLATFIWNVTPEMEFPFLDMLILCFTLIWTILIPPVGRWLRMHTCKIPVWPQEIEEECKIEPGDPYIRDAQHLAARNDD